MERKGLAEPRVRRRFDERTPADFLALPFAQDW